MDSILKAKVIIELLDDRKYSVLSSFSNDELNKLNNVSLEDLNGLGASDINSIISEFMTKVESKISLNNEIEKDEKGDEGEINNQEKAMDALPPLNIENEETEIIEKPLTIEEKIQQQPVQLLACILNRVDDEKKLELLAHVDDEKKQLIESIEVESTPISEQVIQVILKELDISS